MRNGELPAEQAIPVCSSPATINAGFELLVALAVGCVRNLKQIVDSLTEMYYIGTAITSKYFKEVVIDSSKVSNSVCHVSVILFLSAAYLTFLANGYIFMIITTGEPYIEKFSSVC